MEMVLTYYPERRFIMERTATFSKSNSPGEYAALISMTASYWEGIPRQKSLQLIGPLTPTTRAYGSTANVPVNSTTASQFIALQGTINGAEDTSGSDVSIISWFDISSLGETTETHICPKNGPSALFWRILVYPDVQPVFELIGKPPLITWLTSAEETSIISSKTSTAKMLTIPLDEELSPEDREARKKGLALVARIEHLMQTDEGFHDWFQEGFDEIAAGHFVTFSEEGWKEE